MQPRPQPRALTGPKPLTPEQEREVADLVRVDRAVHAHEQAHLGVAGSYARGGASYRYVTGPDGKKYAVAGEVQIDTSPIAGHPDSTVMKMQQVQRAALAPVDPSSQDRRVAAQASQSEAEARAEESAGTRAVPTGHKSSTMTSPSAQDAAARTQHLDLSV